ncbi:uncharacterized protein YALI1_B08102g [Yarrowia lipolytica]|uniref:Uncharacterized protein n=1 Tax=Yarrowia lipolytica TaxID=4952 RepID=A0A1D8N6N7_YARLL|nr:hypothetical protein YALI1_B08102g [Yarrowia lipolytica]
METWNHITVALRNTLQPVLINTDENNLFLIDYITVQYEYLYLLEQKNYLATGSCPTRDSQTPHTFNQTEISDRFGALAL